MQDDSTLHSNLVAFPTLDEAELKTIRKCGSIEELDDGDIAFKVGDAELDLIVVESGALEILNPSDSNRHIITHHPGQFAGDIDLLTGRPAIVTAIARGKTKILRFPSAKLREILNKVPRLSEKLFLAIQERRRLLSETQVIGLKVVGSAECRDTNRVREFLFKNFVPFTWFDSEGKEGTKLLQEWGLDDEHVVIECGTGEKLLNPHLRDLAKAAGVWRHCPCNTIDLAIIGAGPAGMAAAVYAASEGVSTVVLDRLGPGGQAAGSSKIENFIGFPSGLSGAELATRSVLQMLKFGAKMVAPVNVDRIVPAATPNELHTLYLDCDTELRARTVLIAGGVQWRRLSAAGAEKFEGAGIHYACTSVEAELFNNQDVAVVGAGNSAGQAAMFLSDCCPDRTVHLIIRKTLGPGMSSYLVGRIRAASNIQVHEGCEISSVEGEMKVERATFKKTEEDAGTEADEASTCTLPLGAIFVFIGAEPGCSWLPDEILRDSLGYVLTGVDALQSGGWPLKDREPCPLETTVPGILAAGDLRAGSTKRVGFAVGDGSLAVTCVHRLTMIRQ